MGFGAHWWGMFRTALLLTLFTACSGRVPVGDTVPLDLDASAPDDTAAPNDTEDPEDVEDTTPPVDSEEPMDTDRPTDIGGSGCVDDEAGPDDGPHVARALTGSASGRICPGDVDWFEVSTEAGCVLSFSLDFTHALGDLDFYLWDAALSLLDLAVSESDDEHLVHVASSSGDLYLQIVGYQAAENDYVLAMSATCPDEPPTCPGDDVFEPNDTPTTAAPLNLFDTMLSGVVCEGDEDWFSLFGFDACVVQVGLDFAHTDGDLDLWLYDPSGALVNASYGVVDGEAFTHHVGADGYYSVLVDGHSGASAAYELAVTQRCDLTPPQDCARDGDDRLEPDDGPAEASALNPFATVVRAIVCPDDDDWFVADLARGCVLEALLDFDPATADLDLVFLDGAGGLVGLSASSDDVERQTWIADADGPLYVVVAGWEGASGPYTLSTWTTCPDDDTPPTCPGDDHFEPNDTPGAAFALNDGETTVTATACDPDWWAVDVEAGCWFSATVDFVHAEGDLDVGLFDGGTLVDWGVGVQDRESLSYIASSASRLDLVVLPFAAGDENGYTLRSALSCPSSVRPACPENDHLEPNDDPLVGPLPRLNRERTVVEAVTCGAESDFFAAWLDEGCSLTAALTFAHGPMDPDLDLYLYDAQDAVLLGVSDSYTADEAVAYTAASAGEVWVEVYSWGGAPGAYTLTTRIDCP